MVRIRPADWDKREGSGWRPLFGAKGLDDWKPAGWAAWNLEKGSLTGSGERGYLFSPALIESGQALSFLEIRAQVMVSNKGEGSLILGAVFDDRDPAGLRLPLNSNARSKARTGSIQGLANVESHLIPNDIWFQFHARAEAVASGLHIQVRVNGVLVGDVVTTKPLATPLRIALEQVGGGSTIQFREIEYRTAKP